jgi:hypothetical protein
MKTLHQHLPGARVILQHRAAANFQAAAVVVRFTRMILLYLAQAAVSQLV